MILKQREKSEKYIPRKYKKNFSQLKYLTLKKNRFYLGDIRKIQKLEKIEKKNLDIL